MNHPGPPNQPPFPPRPMGHPGPPVHPMHGLTPPHRLAQPTPARRHRGRAKLLTALAVAVAAVGITGGAAWSFFGTQSAAEVQPVAASQVFLESVGTAGAQPFMAPVGQDRAGLTQPQGTSGAFAGDTPGLFAENPEQPSCDAQSLLTNLQADPAKAGAWAQALAIKTEDIPGFIETLKPVVLRADTAVTSHGYDNGTFTAYPAVLQAGTAVFVNSYGEPTVKCYSGNPLTKAIDYTQASYVGPSWSYFAPTAVTYVDPTPTVITNYTYVDVDHGGFHHRPSWCSEHPDSHNCHHNPGPNPGPDPGPKHTPDPKLEEAAKKAAEVAKAANEAFTKADQNARQFEINQRNAESDATALETIAAEKAALLAKDPNNPALQQASAAADADAKQARQNAQTAAAQAQFQRKAADAIKKNKDAADAAAKKAQDEADKAAGRKTADQKNGNQPGIENQAENKGQDGDKDKNLVDGQAGGPDAKNTVDPTDNKVDVPAETKAETPADDKAETPADKKAETPADKKADPTGDQAVQNTAKTGGGLTTNEKATNGTAGVATTAKKSADAQEKAQAGRRAADAVTKNQQARRSEPLPQSKVIKPVQPEQKQTTVERERKQTPAQSESDKQESPAQSHASGGSNKAGGDGDGGGDGGGE